MSEKHAEAAAHTTAHTETHEAKAEGAVKETKHEATAETKKQVDTALNWDHPKHDAPKDHKDTAPAKSAADLDARMKAENKEQDAKQKDISAQWSRDNAATKERTATDYKWQAEHADTKLDRDYYAAQAASAKGDAAGFRREAAEHKAESASLRASAAEIRSQHTSDKAEAVSQKGAAEAHHKDADAWRNEANRQKEDSYQKHQDATEIRTKGVEAVATEKGYVKPPASDHHEQKHHDVKV
jgi:hypothetical protein